MTVDAYTQQVHEAMVTDVVSVSPEDTLHDVLDTMLENGLSTLPVVDDDRICVGVIAAVDLLAPTHSLDTDLHKLATNSTEGRADFVETFERLGMSGHRVEDFMSTRVISVGPQKRLPEAAAIMLNNQVHHLVVTGPEGRIAGILSTMDILEAFSRPGRDPSSRE